MDYCVYRLLYGREEMPARWKFCIAYVNGNLGMAVGSLFVTKYFDVQSKQDVCSIVH
jgi:predicted metalloendopeptidase